MRTPEPLDTGRVQTWYSMLNLLVYIIFYVCALAP